MAAIPPDGLPLPSTRNGEHGGGPVRRTAGHRRALRRDDRVTVCPEPPITIGSVVEEPHTRLLRLALGVEEARAYWQHVDPAVPRGRRAVRAFEERWFGRRTHRRVKTLLPYLAARYDAYPEALEVLRRWQRRDLPLDPEDRQVLCHWHLQLSDPIYRRFTAEVLLARRSVDPCIDRTVAARWIRQTYPQRWSEGTVSQFAGKLMSAATEAGLLRPARDPREMVFPSISGHSLAYLLYLLRHLRGLGPAELLHNPYLASVGLTGAALEYRLAHLPGISVHRMGPLAEFEWACPSLTAWAERYL